MAEHESPEFGKADFVLLDSVSMQEFMANLKLRWAFYLHADEHSGMETSSWQHLRHREKYSQNIDLKTYEVSI